MARTIAASADIDAPKERVWAIVRDVARYPEWSPFLVAVEGELAAGRPLGLVVRMRMREGERPTRQTEHVSRLVEGGPSEPSEVAWGIRWGGAAFFAAERFQRVTPLAPGRCRYETADTFQGLLAPIVLGLYGAHIQAGFEATARALKARAERSG